jgi:cyclopropane-fatty-acyl-phospholipid synthase
MSVFTSARDKLTNAAARRVFEAAVSKLTIGDLIIETPNGITQEYDSGNPGPSGVLRIHDNSFYGHLIMHGEVGFGETYQRGWCSSPDLVSLVRLAVLNRQAVDLNKGPLRLLSKRGNKRLHASRRNTEEQSKHNIHAHYDLGNDFFSLFLDETMTYSAAVFEEPGEALADAQRNKYRRMCERARLTSDEHVLEIGTGWGGLAIFAAGTYGCKVTTVTISKEQFILATQRVADAGLSGLVDVRMIDYRDVSGQYDKLISIEMFEAVGAEYFEIFFEKCSDLLKPGGRLVMQVITVPDRSYGPQLAGSNWIQKYIFPGGILPSLAEMERSNIHTGLVIDSIDDIGPHYATTLHLWRDSFWAHIDEVRSQGYDQHFINTWDYYLAVCEAGFITRNTGVVQIAFDKVS